MAQKSKPTLTDIEDFARRHGLDRLAPEHLQRMTELALYVGDLGRTLPRPSHKEDAPAFDFRPGESPEQVKSTAR